MAKHVFITGQPGVGKTTLVRKVVERLAKERAIETSGFYTDELRGPEGRIGFDVVTLSGVRGPLARMGNPRKGEPAVGKYKVDIPAFERLALSELHLQNQRLVVVDEVGKMELLSRNFMPAVNRLLADPQGPVVFGTVPMPRYGRTIPQVEELKERTDVTVIKISKDTQDQAAEEVYKELVARIEATEETSTGDRGQDTMPDLLPPPVRPGATLPAVRSTTATDATLAIAKGRGKQQQPQPCGPLVGDPISNPPPRTLLLGLSASPLPDDPAMSYSERSLWKVLDIITGSSPMDPYHVKVSKATGIGVALWDVLADVHIKQSPGTWSASGGGGKRPRSARSRQQAAGKGSQNPNDLAAFLKSNPTIDTLAFNGTKAAATTKSLMPDLLSNFRVEILPSSSGANSSMSLQKKAEAWQKVIMRS